MVDRGISKDVSLERLLLNLSNPRHEEMDGRDEAIIELLQHEQVVELARDIVQVGGINPLERMGVFPLEGAGSERNPFYVTAEGNRRLCALILLEDPDAVPAEMPNRTRYVRTFKQLSKDLDPIEKIPVIVFESMEASRPWLERLHNGARDGTGRRRWTPEQQARNTADITNRAATELRDLAISLGFVPAEDLGRTTTTQQRFASNAKFRHVLGIVRMEDGSLQRTKCWHDFKIMLQKFISDVVSGRVNSRKHNNKKDIEAYATELENIEGLLKNNVPQGALGLRAGENEDGSFETASADGTSIPHAAQGNAASIDSKSEGTGPSESDDDDDESESGKGGSRPLRRRNSIGVNDEVVAALHRLGNQKLIDLYNSIGTVRLPQHTLLAVVGCWSFLESMTRAHGRNDTTPFDAYLHSQAKLLGVENTPDKGLRRLSLDWILRGGNVTKHDWQGAAYDPSQLYNAMDSLNPIIVALIDDAADKKNGK